MQWVLFVQRKSASQLYGNTEQSNKTCDLRLFSANLSSPNYLFFVNINKKETGCVPLWGRPSQGCVVTVIHFHIKLQITPVKSNGARTIIVDQTGKHLGESDVHYVCECSTNNGEGVNHKPSTSCARPGSEVQRFPRYSRLDHLPDWIWSEKFILDSLLLSVDTILYNYMFDQRCRFQMV